MLVVGKMMIAILVRDVIVSMANAFLFVVDKLVLREHIAKALLIVRFAPVLPLLKEMAMSIVLSVSRNYFDLISLRLELKFVICHFSA